MVNYYIDCSNGQLENKRLHELVTCMNDFFYSYLLHKSLSHFFD